jgi:hypothetical protein
MVIYDAKIFLKQEATQEKCIDLFLKWIKNSPQYKEKSKGLIQNACDLKDDEYQYNQDSIQLLIKCYHDASNTITACQFINTEVDGNWTVSVVYFQTENENPYILVQQEFDGIITKRKKPHRPFIVKLILDNGWIDSKQYLSIDNKKYGIKDDKQHYFTVTEKSVEDYAHIILGGKNVDLPLVYFSYDFPNNKYAISKSRLEKLAIDLIGTAYVAIDSMDSNVIDQLSLRCNTKKIFRGHIGIYFPNSDEYIRINPYTCKLNDVSDIIRQIIWNEATLNRSDKDITWKVLLNLCEWKELYRSIQEEIRNKRSLIYKMNCQLNFYRKISNGKNVFKIPSLEEIESCDTTPEECRNLIVESIKDVELVYEYDQRIFHLVKALLSNNEESNICNLENQQEEDDNIFVDCTCPDESYTDLCNNAERELDELKREIYSLKAQLSVFECESIQVISIPETEKEFFEGEFSDLILQCLTKKKEKEEIKGQSRAVGILQKIIDENPSDFIGKKYMKEIEELIEHSDPWTEAKERQFEQLGFIFTDRRKHHKAYFKEKRYNVSFSCTASDHRTAQNTKSDIMHKISIYR